MVSSGSEQHSASYRKRDEKILYRHQLLYQMLHWEFVWAIDITI